MKKKQGSRGRKAREVIFGQGARVVALCLGVGVSLALLVCCLTFDIADAPSPYVVPQDEPPVN